MSESLYEQLLNARLRLKAGDRDAAKRAYETVLQCEPTHAEALNFIAVSNFELGRWDDGRKLLRRAAAAAPDDPLVHANLGLAYQQANELDLAAEALTRAVELCPDLYEARLHLGVIKQRLGLRYEALENYFWAIAQAQRKGNWLDKASTPAHLRSSLGMAMEFVVRFKRETFDLILEPLVRRYGESELGRVRRCIATLLDDLAEIPSDGRQRCRMLFLPGLPTSPYFSRALFSWIPELESKVPVIRQELDSVLGSSSLEPFLRLSARSKMSDYVVGANENSKWEAYFFFRHGESVDSHLLDCPQTAQALREIPLAQVKGNAPEVLFSILTPGTRILPHYGSTNTRTVVHLPLIVPKRCALVVGGEIHVWEEGSCVAFDDTFEHEAWNQSDEVRVVLILDVWNPYLTEAERMAVSHIAPSLADYARATRLN